MTFTWYPGNNIEQFKPYIQVYGVVFNNEGKMLIQRRENCAWCLAGGTVELNETAEDTLRRELIEEADVTIKNPRLLGGQRVQFPCGHNPNPGKRAIGDDFYQLRYYSEVDELLPQTPDPDYGTINDRIFVLPSEINNYLNWGVTGQAIFDQAIDLWRELHPTPPGE
jgi:8-oxo-dGTP pyrophosphatase MutT (NUDIX family)